MVCGRRQLSLQFFPESDECGSDGVTRRILHLRQVEPLPHNRTSEWMSSLGLDTSELTAKVFLQLNKHAEGHMLQKAACIQLIDANGERMSRDIAIIPDAKYSDYETFGNVEIREVNEVNGIHGEDEFDLYKERCRKQEVYGLYDCSFTMYTGTPDAQWTADIRGNGHGYRPLSATIMGKLMATS